jgi:hypothetical protein
MRLRNSRTPTLVVLALVLWTAGASAQQGHPMEGTWQGLWGRTGVERNFLTLILRWNGSIIVGTVNPGPNEGAIREVELDTSTWTVRIDLDVPDRLSGETVRVRAECRLYDIGSPRRTVRGVLEGDVPDSYFRISRQ